MSLTKLATVKVVSTMLTLVVKAAVVNQTVINFVAFPLTVSGKLDDVARL